MSKKSKTQNNLVKYLSPLSKKMLSTFEIPPYHFVELFIYFDNFIEDGTVISKESFTTANSSLSQIEDDENEIDNLSENIFSIISGGSPNAHLHSLCIYLKQIAITDDITVNEDVLFDILDKTQKGYIDYSDIEILVSSLEDFCDTRKRWDEYEESFAGKKITKRNLSQNELDKQIFDLIAKADSIIQRKIEQSLSTTGQSRSLQTKNSFINNNEGNNNERKDNYNFLYETEDENKLVGAKSKPLCDMIFDNQKSGLVHKIKMASFLYDITLKEFINGISTYKKESTFDKGKFISVLGEIIQANTSNLFKFPYQKLALSMLFQIIDIEHKNVLNYYEILGGVFTLTKSTNPEKVEFIFSFEKKYINQIISAMLSLYINTSIIHDVEIFSEIFIGLLSELNISKSSDALDWLFSSQRFPICPQEGDNIEDIDDNFNDESIITTESKKTSFILETLKERFNQAKKKISLNIQNMSIIDVTYKLLQHSLLGEINNFQLSSLLDSVLSDTSKEMNQKEMQKAKAECMEAIEKYFDFSQNELIDITTLHSFFLLIFAGSTIEKMQSIFIINDVNENESIDVDDLIDYFAHLFDYLLKEMKIVNQLDPTEIAREITNMLAKGKEKISLIMLVQFYESVVHDIHD